MMSAIGVALDRDETALSTAIQSPSAPSLPHGIPTSTQEMRSPPRDRSLDEDKPSEESNENGANNNDGFQTVRKKRKKNNNIVGSKKMPGNLTIRSAMRTADIYVGNCDLDVTVESLSDYIHSEIKVKVLQCELLVSKNPRCKSFKVTLNMNDRPKLLSAETWPEEIVGRKFL